MKKRITGLMKWSVLVIFIIFLGWRILEVIGSKNADIRRGVGGAVAVEVESVKIESIEEIRNFSGSIEAEYSYIIASKISGRLVKLYKNVGDFVSANDLIATLDDAEYQQTLLEVQANLTIAKASLIDAESQLVIADRDLKQAESLFEKKFISETDLEKVRADLISAQTKVELAKAQVEQREAALRLAEIKLDYTVLRASKAGFIGQRFNDEGSLLSVNSPVVSIVGIEHVIVRSNLVERIYGRINTGMQAAITTDAYPDEIFTGRVFRISPVLNEQSRMAEMEIKIPNNSNLLKPGMFCRIELILSEKENAQTVPNGAILKENDHHGIFVVNGEENTALYVPVKIGVSNDTRTEIISPEIQFPVITLGHYQVKDGSKVLISNQPEKNGE